MNALASTTVLECPYCGTVHGLRIKSQNPRTGEIDAICAKCFKGTDDGPGFDDLPVAPFDWQAYARARREYEDPYGYSRSRY